ncbi:MAG: hypothetical protein LBR77_01090 [Lachnospiraceae bacterium]|jgi:hypothetical protein|nr:hypothetical protein [Lachnospiraceae bacterium]
MTNFERFADTFKDYFDNHGLRVDFFTDMRQASRNDDGSGAARCIYIGKRKLDVIDMDAVAKEGYYYTKDASSDSGPINSVDAFLINYSNEWFFIEFKDTKINADKSKTKDNIIKKAYSNWYMILDILFESKDAQGIRKIFDFENPVHFAKQHVHYILVCPWAKNPQIFEQVRNHEKIGERYTPPFMCRLKDYLFKDVYAYTEDVFERKFVNVFEY